MQSERSRTMYILAPTVCAWLLASCIPDQGDAEPTIITDGAGEGSSFFSDIRKESNPSQLTSDSGSAENLSVPQFSADSCSALVLHTVSSPSGDLVKGTVRSQITQYWIAKDGGEQFCEKGAGCYPARAYVAGEGETDTVQFLNCRRGELFSEGADGLGFFMELDRVRTTDGAIRIHDVKNRLVEQGMGLASADNAARHYVSEPDGRCGRLVKRMLEGDPAAEGALVPNPPTFCTYETSPAL